jgi:hypothetical protein
VPKKDTATAVLGMLSNAGAQTRLAPPEAPAASAPAPVAATVQPVVAVSAPADVRPTASLSTLAPTPAKAADTAPRTLRLQAGTARALRDAWLEAKRDDVLLTAQDFASALVDEALARRRRQSTVRSG